MRIIASRYIMLLLGAFFSLSIAAATADAPTYFVLLSDDLANGFRHSHALNAYGCTGGNQSPSLRWQGAPAGTRSFIVTLYDPDDHDSPSGWWHWVVYDIPANSMQLQAGAGSAGGAKLPVGAKLGRSDLGTLSYHGPCPPKRDGLHGYTFTVYALDVAKLDLEKGAGGAMVVETAHDHIIDKATLVVQHKQ